MFLGEGIESGGESGGENGGEEDGREEDDTGAAGICTRLLG